MKDKKKKEVRLATKSFFSGFKDFITKGNVVDMAIGVIIGGAFGKIVTSLVNDIIMPPISILTGGVDFKDLKWIIKKEILEAGVVIKPALTINYGNFLMIILEFLIIAFAIYFVLNMVIRRKQFIEKVEKELEELNKNDEEEQKEEIIEEPSEEILLLREIRDSLKK